jgi:uncharacterized RDD family membrane protein YckC
MQPAASFEIATPEAVALDFDVAGLGHRALAWCVDACLIATAWFTALFILSYVRTYDLTRLGGVSAAVQLLLVGGFFFTNWGYGLVFESVLRGQTPGKRLLGIRVVRKDGSPAGFVDLALRNLARGVDFLPLFYVAGVVTLMATRPSRRLGDLLAGTLVIREHQVDLSRYQVNAPPSARGQAPLTAAQLELVLGFLRRAPELEDAARDGLAQKLAALFAMRLPEGERGALSHPPTAEAFLRALVKGEA